MGNLRSKVMRQRVPMAYVLSVNVFALLERAEIIGNQKALRLELRTQAERVNTSSPKHREHKAVSKLGAGDGALQHSGSLHSTLWPR